jgi:predicted transcriptional regulator
VEAQKMTTKKEIKSNRDTLKNKDLLKSSAEKTLDFLTEIADLSSSTAEYTLKRLTPVISQNIIKKEELKSIDTSDFPHLFQDIYSLVSKIEENLYEIEAVLSRTEVNY